MSNINNYSSSSPVAKKSQKRLLYRPNSLKSKLFEQNFTGLSSLIYKLTLLIYKYIFTGLIIISIGLLKYLGPYRFHQIPIFNFSIFYRLSTYLIVKRNPRCIITCYSSSYGVAAIINNICQNFFVTI